MSDIFISYARVDKARVQPLAHALEQKGWSVWWDHRIRTGQSWDEVIQEAMDAAKAVVVVWTATSVMSHWVKSEARQGLERRVLFPVMLLENVKIPLGFGHLQTAGLMNWQPGKDHSDFEKFVDDIAQAVGPPSRAGVQQAPVQQPRTEVPADMVKVPKGLFLDYDYWIDQYPITNEKYRAFILEGGYGDQGYWSAEGWKWKTEYNITCPKFWNDTEWNKADHPVVGISYYEAEAYARWVGKRLPTEQEWAKAARGEDGRKYPWGNEFDKNKCNSIAAAIRHTTPVIQYIHGVSPYGCYDMVGNVWEWCVDWHDTEKYSHVIRGGSWVNDPEDLRISSRSWGYADDRDSNLGCRLAQNIDG